MNEAQTIKAAIERRFSRAAVPDVPLGPWRAEPARALRPHAPSRRFAYASTVLGVFVAAGVAAQASGTLPAYYARLVGFGGSAKPLPPLVHRADRLTITQAQQHMPFQIVVPAGLPAHTSLQYAHVVSEQPIPRVALNYQTQIGGRYYRININETTAVSGPPVTHFEAIFKGKDGRSRHQTWTVPLRRWKHGAVVMEMVPAGLPAPVVDRIVRETTR
jgi:hypothetical protein